MRIGRTLPPAAAPISCSNLLSGVRAGVRGEAATERFTEELKTYFQVKHCFLLSSGKAALLLILNALKGRHPERDEVLIPALTCFSVPSAIIRAGLKIRLCDMDRETLDFDYSQLVAKLENPKLLCVIPTHLFGRPSDVQRLRAMVINPAVTIVEDAAQAFGGESGGQKLGTLGDVSLFSLGRGKALSTVEGGIILTNQADIARRIEETLSRLQDRSRLQILQLCAYALALAMLQHPNMFWLPNALPVLKLGKTVFDPIFETYKFSAFQAGLAKGWQQKITQLKLIRKRHSADWIALLDGLGLLHYGRVDGEIPDLIRLPCRTGSVDLCSHIIEKSRQFGLGIAAIYPTSIAQIPGLNKNFRAEEFPVAEECARTVITLPVHPYLSVKDKSSFRRILPDAFSNRDAGCFLGEKEGGFS